MMPTIITMATMVAVTLPLPHSLWQGSFGFVTDSLSISVRHGEPPDTRCWQRRLLGGFSASSDVRLIRLDVSVAINEGPPPLVIVRRRPPPANGPLSFAVRP